MNNTLNKFKFFITLFFFANGGSAFGIGDIDFNMPSPEDNTDVPVIDDVPSPIGGLAPEGGQNCYPKAGSVALPNTDLISCRSNCSATYTGDLQAAYLYCWDKCHYNFCDGVETPAGTIERLDAQIADIVERRNIINEIPGLDTQIDTLVKDIEPLKNLLIEIVNESVPAME